VNVGHHGLEESVGRFITPVRGLGPLQVIEGIFFAQGFDVSAHLGGVLVLPEKIAEMLADIGKQHLIDEVDGCSGALDIEQDGFGSWLLMEGGHIISEPCG
jgi:hypothetical protein